MYYVAQYLRACAICACTFSAHVPYALCTTCFDSRIFILDVQSWLLQVTNASLYLNQPKSKEKEDEKETELAVLPRQRNSKRTAISGQMASPRQSYMRAALISVEQGKHVCNTGMIGSLQNQLKKESLGYS